MKTNTTQTESAIITRLEYDALTEQLTQLKTSFEELQAKYLKGKKHDQIFHSHNNFCLVQQFFDIYTLFYLPAKAVCIMRKENLEKLERRQKDIVEKNRGLAERLERYEHVN